MLFRALTFVVIYWATAGWLRDIQESSRRRGRDGRSTGMSNTLMR